MIFIYVNKCRAAWCSLCLVLCFQRVYGGWQRLLDFLIYTVCKGLAASRIHLCKEEGGSVHSAKPCRIRQDGRLEYTEFIAAAMDQRLHQNETLCWRAFKAFDRDDDDKITYPDLQHVLQAGIVKICLDGFEVSKGRKSKYLSAHPLLCNPEPFIDSTMWATQGTITSPRSCT